MATLGASLDLDASLFRNIAAVLLLILGVVLLSANLQAKFASITAPVGNSGQNALSRFSADTLGGQFILGMLLGIVWSPCVGPILGATVILAAQGKELGHVITVMAILGWVQAYR